LIQGRRKQVEKKEDYELQVVKAMVMGRQWDGATLAMKTQQPVMHPTLHLTPKHPLVTDRRSNNGQNLNKS